MFTCKSTKQRMLCANATWLLLFGKSRKVLLLLYSTSSLVPSIKTPEQSAAISLVYAERGCISSIVLYNVPNTVTHTQSWVLRHLINLYITYSSTVPLLLSQLLSLFPQEIQPNQVHCSLCSFVDPRGITLHLTRHITFKSSLGCPFLSAKWARSAGIRVIIMMIMSIKCTQSSLSPSNGKIFVLFC